MGMEQPPDRLEPLLVEADVRAVRVALLVRERVMLAVIGHPGGHGPLDRGRAEDRQQRADRPGGREAPVGEVAVKADGHAEAGQRVEQREHRQAVPVHTALQALPGHESQAEHRDDRHQARRDPVHRLVFNRLHLCSERIGFHRVLLFSEPALRASSLRARNSSAGSVRSRSWSIWSFVRVISR